MQILLGENLFLLETKLLCAQFQPRYLKLHFMLTAGQALLIDQAAFTEVEGRLDTQRVERINRFSWRVRLAFFNQQQACVYHFGSGFNQFTDQTVWCIHDNNCSCMPLGKQLLR